MGVNFLKYFNDHSCVKIVRLMLLISINDVFESDQWENITGDMFRKFSETLIKKDKDALHKYFGKYGLYFIFKTIAKISDQKDKDLALSVPGL